MTSDGSLEDGKRTGAELVLFQDRDLVFTVSRLLAKVEGDSCDRFAHVNSLRGFVRSSLSTND